MKKNVDKYFKRIKTMGRRIMEKGEADEIFLKAMDGDRLVQIEVL